LVFAVGTPAVLAFFVGLSCLPIAAVGATRRAVGVTRRAAKASSRGDRRVGQEGGGGKEERERRSRRRRVKRRWRRRSEERGLRLGDWATRSRGQGLHKGERKSLDT